LSIVNKSTNFDESLGVVNIWFV